MTPRLKIIHAYMTFVTAQEGRRRGGKQIVVKQLYILKDVVDLLC